MNNLGGTYFGMTDTSFLEPYWRIELCETPPPRALQSVSTRYMVYRQASSVVRDFVTPLSADLPDNWKKKLCKFFAKSNHNFTKKSCINLHKYGYPI